MKIYCVIILFILYSDTFTQPVIDYDNFFDFNKHYTKTIFFAPFHEFALPDTGKNLVWDYSFIKDLPDLFTFYDTLFFVDPANTPFYGDPLVNYKRSNICFVESVNIDPFSFEYYYYYLTSTTEINFIGSWADDLSNERYWYDHSDLRLDYKFPMYYSMSIVDSFKARWDDQAAGIRYNQQGTSSILGDGYGKIITPSKDTISNVLKITFSLDYEVFSVAEVSQGHSKTHIWFSKDKRGPIIVIEEINNYISAVEEYKEINLVNITETDEVLLQSELSIYPNPVASEANISLPSSSAMNVFVYNILGQVVRQYNIANKNILSFYREDLPNGIYILLVVRNHKILATKKFLIVR